MNYGKTLLGHCSLSLLEKNQTPDIKIDFPELVKKMIVSNILKVLLFTLKHFNEMKVIINAVNLAA